MSPFNRCGVIISAALGTLLCITNTNKAEDLYISEFMAANATTITDEDGDYSDWVEIYNPDASSSIDLTDWYLTDDAGNLIKWQFPTTSLPADSHIIVFASGKDRSAAGDELHTNFKLSADGEFLALVRPDGITIEHQFEPQYPPQQSDISYGCNGGECGYFASPTPEATNDTTTYFGFVPAPEPDISRGCYSASVTVALSCSMAEAAIRYTLDGSQPTEASTEYTSPISISTTTYLRARAFRTGWLPSAIATHTYFIGVSSAIRSLPVMSIVGDAGSDLYEPDGIMAIVGGHYEDGGFSWVPDGPEDYNNPMQEGDEWERSVSVELIQPDDNSAVQTDCGIRVQGSEWHRPSFHRCPWTQHAWCRFSFKLHFRSRYGNDRFVYPIFPMSPISRFHRMVLRGGWDDTYNPFIKDELIRRLHMDMGYLVSTGSMVSLFINGEYRGYFNPCEFYNEQYFRDVYDEEEDWDVIPYTLNPRDGDLVAFNEMLHLATHYDLSIPYNYQQVADRLDITAFIDYLILELYAGNRDWPNNNWLAARRRIPDDKFRFYVWDIEASMRSDDLSETGFADFPPWFDAGERGLDDMNTHLAQIYRGLMANLEFRQLWADRCQILFFNDGPLSADNIAARFNELRSEMASVIPSMSTYITSTWIPQRPAIVFAAFIARGLWNFDTPIFNINGSPQHGGQVTAGSELTLDNPHGAGTVYYTLNGYDPRSEGGGVSQHAIVFDGSPIIISSDVHVLTRVEDGGEWSALNEAGFQTQTMPVIITEIMYNPAGDADEEFLELYNPSSTLAVDLSGWRLNGVGFTFSSGTVIQSEQYLVVVRDQAAFEAVYGTGVEIAAEYDGQLDNGGENLTLLNAAGQIVDTVRYDDDAPWPITPDGQGPSLELIDLTQDNNRPANWAASASPLGTPGAANSAAGTTDAVPLLWVNEALPVNATINSDEQNDYDPWVELYNSSESSIDLGGMYLTDDYATPDKWPIPAGTSLDTGEWLVIWCDNEPGEGDLHTNFELNPAGGSIGLYTSGSVMVDYLNYDSLPADISYGKFPDGASVRQEFSTPTPGSANQSDTVPIILNEYNAVASDKFLKDNGTDIFFGSVEGNGGNWFELVVTQDHLDLRGWKLSWTEEPSDTGTITLSSDSLWSDLRAGTIITFTESNTSEGGYDTDVSYDPGSGDWWINVNTLSGGIAQETYATTTTNVSGDGPGNFSVGNDGWQLTILDSFDSVQFGPAGEGIEPSSGIGSDEIFKLEADPTPYIHPHSDYNDGTSSTFGAPNVWADGLMQQDFTDLRSNYEPCEYDEDCNDYNPCTDDSCDPFSGCIYTATANGTPCEDGLFCNGSETCQNGVCVDGLSPCDDDCEQCDDENDVCRWCIYDMDHDGFIGPGDFSFFAGCYGSAYGCDAPDYLSGAEACCISNFDQSDDSFVGPGDFSGFAGCFGMHCQECDTCWGPAEE